MPDVLEDLERRVRARYAELVSDTVPDHVFNPEEWLLGENHYSVKLFGESFDVAKVPAAQQVPQFPREQWITYPHRRAAILTIVDRSLDLWGSLTQEQRWQINFLLAYGGRERIA
jgi:hypothetical protein